MAYPIHLPKQAGDHLRALRVQQGMSQADVAV